MFKFVLKFADKQNITASMLNGAYGKMGMTFATHEEAVHFANAHKNSRITMLSDYRECDVMQRGGAVMVRDGAVRKTTWYLVTLSQ